MDHFYSDAAADVVSKYMSGGSADTRPWLDGSDPATDALAGLKRDLSEARQEAARYKSELAGFRTQALTAQTRALDAENNNLNLEKALETANRTIENLRQVVVSQEATIAGLQTEARMKELRESSLQQELHVAQEVIRVAQGAKLSEDRVRVQQAVRGTPYSPVPSELQQPGRVLAAALSPSHTAAPSQQQQQQPQPQQQQPSPARSQSAASGSRGRTDALLHQVRHLQQALDASLQKRHSLSSEVGSLALNFEASLDQSQQLALDATSDKWRANLQASSLATEHGAYADRVSTLEEHVLRLQGENQALLQDRKQWLPEAVGHKLETSGLSGASVRGGMGS